MSPSRIVFWILFAFFLLRCQSGRVTEKAEASYEGDKFQEHIRTTKARTPEQERQGFQLPEGFKIELFASEPDIGKPMNIAFDTQGRLWVSQSFEYPFPAEPGNGKDRISVLEDTDGDGQADKFIHYEDTLNIPIGLLPLAHQTLAYSIPNLYSFQDTDSDTRADQSKVVLGEFGHQDTHGMVNNLTRGYDGWVYTCHGFTNTSTVAGADGDSISMTSGNTFRFLPDGSRVEQTTFGQVNPFGLAFDEWGYLYSTDCHT
ncbi:MAG: PVC-type heme-binding CxxCH protein, partial [Bacteroidota bacterium]